MAQFRFTTIIVVFALLVLSGCEGRTTLSTSVVGRSLKMKLPQGWKVSKVNELAFYESGKREDNVGNVEYSPLGAENLQVFIDTILIYAIHGTVISRSPTTIDNREAIEIVSEGEKHTEIAVVIKTDFAYIRVKFRVLKGDFSKHESLLRESLQTIRISLG